MAVYVVKSSQLRSDAAKILKGLRKGDRYVLMHYKEPLGMISPDIPKDVLKRLDIKEKPDFKQL